MFSFRNYSILQKLTWMNILACGMALGIACTAFIAYDIISFRASIMRNLSIQAQIVGANSVSALLFNDSQSAGKTLGALRSAPNIVQAAIYTTQGDVFAAYKRDAADGATPEKIPVSLDEQPFNWLCQGRIKVVSPILFEGKVRGQVYIESGLHDLSERIHRYVIIVSGVFLVSLFASMLMFLLIRRSVSVPIMRLAETARMVSHERNYSVRVAAGEGRDELSGLIATFNHMLEQIETRDRELQEAHNNLELRVQERTAQLNAVNGELEAFSYSVSHDLRAPLRHMSAFSQLLNEEHGEKLDPDARHYVERIQEGAKRMGLLVDDLLKMGQVSRRSLTLAATDLNSLIKDVLAELQPECKGRNIHLKIAELPGAECDSGLMKQVFANLLSNAVKYSRKREQATIEVGMIETDNTTAIFVRDNGAGFDQRYADKLFGVFQRLHRADEFEGTGVGLATVQRIIKKHGGKIWAEGAVDKGSTFYFTISGLKGSRNLHAEAATAVG